jgi:hypothetical protein
MKKFLLVDAADCVVFDTDDKQAAYEYQNRRRPDCRLVYNTAFGAQWDENRAEVELALDMMRAAGE